MTHHPSPMDIHSARIASYARFMIQTPDEKIAVLYGVLDWLEANPDNAITHAMAQDDSGWNLDPRCADAACFCFVGRLQHETRLPDNLYGLKSWFSDLGVTTGVFIGTNDAHADKKERFTALRKKIDDLALANGVTPS